MKRICMVLAVLLCLLLGVCAFPVEAEAADSDITWTLSSSGTLTISGSGEMEQYPGDSYTPWYESREQIKKVVIKSGITYIGDFAFSECTNLTSVTIPNSVKRIGYRAFYNCTSLTAVTLPTGLEHIQGDAFGKSGLTSFAIPKAVEYIDANPVSGCQNLTKITVDAANPYFCTNSSGALLNKGKTELYAVPGAKTGSYTVPNTVKTIYHSAFYGCAGLTSVSLGTGVQSIESWAFAYCTGLTSLTLPNSLTRIGYASFSNCTGLTAISIPDSVSEIEDFAFMDCSGLKSVTLGSGVTNLGYDVFARCDELNSITVSKNNPKFSSDSKGVLIDKKEGQILYVPKSISGSYTVPSSVTKIEYAAFRERINLTEIIIPDSVTEIGAYAFDDCDKLKSIKLGNGVKSIGQYAFNDFKTDVYIKNPSTWCKISWFAWPESGNRLFIVDQDWNILTNATIVLDNSVTEIRDCTFLGCQNVSEIIIPDSVTYIGNWAFVDNDQLKSVTIPGSVKVLGHFAFSGCNSLSSVSLGNGVMKIGHSVFARASFTSIVIPDSVTYIGNEAFANCTSLKEVKLSKNLTELYNRAFMCCTSLKTIEIPDGMKKIGEFVFSNCTGLVSVALPESVETIDTYAFNKCGNLRTVFYGGTKAQKAKINFPLDDIDNEDGNSNLKNAQWHYEVTSFTLNGKTAYRCGECGKTFYADGTRVSSTINITSQPQSVKVASGETAKVTVGVTGSGLTYAWYFKNSGGTKFNKTDTFTGNSYSLVMNEDRNGRQVYCIITDKYGNTAQTETVTLSIQTPLKITRQPENIAVLSGETALVTVEATGDGLTYAWYFKNSGGTKFNKTDTFTGDSYSLVMNEDRDGRQVYCVITDEYGNSVQSKVATLQMEIPLKITRQPESVKVATGETAKVTVGVTGDGLTYAWYFKNSGGTKFNKTNTFTGNSYSIVMNEDRDGRQVYCVITDEYGNSVQSKVATLQMETPLKITRQPESVKVATGETAEVVVEATGDGLTYAWYFKNSGGTKFNKTNTFTGNSYSLTMNEDRNGRQVYCVITDQHGNTIQSEIVTFSMITPLQITRQPESVKVATGETAEVVVEATGDGLTYAWYLKNKNSQKFSYTDSFDGNVYAVKMNSTRNGRQIYCVITDQYGNSVETEVVTLSMQTPLKITQQPESVVAASGEIAEVTVKATGDGLTYQWYYKNKGSKKFSLTTSFDGDTYSVTMSSGRNGRQIYCVITDRYGNSVRTNTVTLSME